VIEPATGHEDDGIIDMDDNEIDFEATQWNNNNSSSNNNSDIGKCVIFSNIFIGRCIVLLFLVDVHFIAFSLQSLVIITIIMLIMTMMRKNITVDGSLTGHTQFTSLYLNYRSQHLNLPW